MRKPTIFNSTLLLIGLFLLIGCAREEQTAGAEVIKDGIPDLNSRASQARAISVENIFIKLPKEAFQAEGWDNISTKDRRHLLSKGSLDAFEANIQDNQIRIKERFQNEDDPNERAAVVEMMVFRHAKEDYNVVYMGQKYVHENGRKSAIPISNKFWRFDGRHWHDISEEVPTIQTADFFEENLDLSAVKEDHIIISPNPKYNNALSANLAYDQYMDYGLSPDEIITKERFFVNLIWNGQMFEKQRKPTVVQ